MLVYFFFSSAIRINRYGWVFCWMRGNVERICRFFQSVFQYKSYYIILPCPLSIQFLLEYLCSVCPSGGLHQKQLHGKIKLISSLLYQKVYLLKALFLSGEDTTPSYPPTKRIFGEIKHICTNSLIFCFNCSCAECSIVSLCTPFP